MDEKLDEELAEYQKDQNLEELADLLDVIFATALARGYSLEELERVRTHLFRADAYICSACGASCQKQPQAVRPAARR